MASFLLRRAEETREMVVRDIGHTPRSPTLIYLAPTWGDFQQVQPRGTPPSWSVGTAYPEFNLIILRSPRAMKGGRVEIDEVLQHEYAHLALWTSLRGQEAPRWLDEGFAMLQSRQWNLSWTYTLAKGVLTKSLIPLQELEDGFPLPGYQAQLAYAESFSFVTFVKNEFGAKALPRLVEGIASGLDVDTALRLATGLGFRELERRWKKELKRRYSWIPIASSFFSLWFLASLLFLLVYWRKRRRAKRILEEWEREESLLESATPPGSSKERDQGS
ncbi:MAG: hypothetical protein JSW32_04780 [Deltaproteobacteria bacterium]|nr:MAG: hypothetical protein JSW32_04780 [Deltaproteobacteria bacterium]